MPHERTYAIHRFSSVWVCSRFTLCLCILLSLVHNSRFFPSLPYHSPITPPLIPLSHPYEHPSHTSSHTPLIPFSHPYEHPSHSPITPPLIPFSHPYEHPPHTPLIPLSHPSSWSTLSTCRCLTPLRTV